MLLANLVLLAKNPLDAIVNIKSTEGIVLSGQHHVADDLKRLANEIRERLYPRREQHR
jgi:hypothetical protein